MGFSLSLNIFIADLSLDTAKTRQKINWEVVQGLKQDKVKKIEVVVFVVNLLAFGISIMLASIMISQRSRPL